MTMTETFAALGNPTRFAIIERLMKEGEKSAGDLATDGEISAPALSRHFRILREAGLIEQRIDKQKRLYSVRRPAIKAISDWSMTYKAFWGGSLDRLADALAEDRHC